MEIKICSLSESDNLFHTWATRCVSLLNPEHKELYGENKTKFRHFQYFDDINAVPIGYTSYRIPAKEQIAEVFEYTKDLKDDDKLLVHCFAGISRSTAMLIGILCQHGSNPVEAYEAVFAVRDQMWPNSLIIKYCDELLNLNGSLIEEDVKFKKEHDRLFYIPASLGITKEDIEEMDRIKAILKAASE